MLVKLFVKSTVIGGPALRLPASQATLCIDNPLSLNRLAPGA